MFRYWQVTWGYLSCASSDGAQSPRFWKCGWPRREQPAARVLRVQRRGRVIPKSLSCYTFRQSTKSHDDLFEKKTKTWFSAKWFVSLLSCFFCLFVFCIVIPQTLVKRTSGRREEAGIICCCELRNWCGRSFFSPNEEAAWKLKRLTAEVKKAKRNAAAGDPDHC